MPRALNQIFSDVMDKTQMAKIDAVMTIVLRVFIEGDTTI